MLTKHLPCCDSSFDLSRVKTEVVDSEKRSTSALSQTGHFVTATDCAFNIGHVKTEVKSEVPDVPATGGSGVHVSNAVAEESALLGLLNKTVVPQYRGRGGRGRGSRGGRGGRRGGLQGTSQKSHLSLPAIKGRMLQCVNSQSLSNFRIPGLNPGGSVHTKLMNILPKADGNGKGNGLRKKDVVNFIKSLEVTNITHTTPTANIVVPSTFTVNNAPGSVSSLTGPNVNTLPFGSLILSSNVLSNTQQDTLFLGGSAPLISPLPGTNTLQTPSLVPSFQTINMSQPLANFTNLNIATNQSTSLGILQNIGQVINSGTQSGGIFTGNMNQTLSSVVSSSQQMSYKVPVLVGNQIILMDMPAQYSTGVSLANTPNTVSLSSFGQSLGLFSSAVTPKADEQQATACIVSTTLPCRSLSANSIHSQPDVTATSLHMSPHLQSHPGTASIIGAQETCESTKTLKPPPPLVLAGCTVSHQSQDGAKLCSANYDALCCEKTTTSSAEVNAKVKLQATQNVKNQRMETQSNENNSANVNKKLNCDRNIPEAQINTQHYKLPVGPVINPVEGTLPKKPSPVPVIINAQSVNNVKLSSMTSVANKISADVKTNKQNVRSLKMETPDSLERKIFPLGKEEKKQSLGINNPVISDTVGTLGMTVKELLRSNKSNNAKNMATLNKSQHAGHQLFFVGPRPKGKLHFRKLPFPKLSEQNKESDDQTLQPLPKSAGISTELPNLAKDDQSNSSIDHSDQSQANDDIICKISEVKSIADAHPQLVLLKNEDCHNLDQRSNDLNRAQGTVFVGPLTKEQLDSIIQNPSELGKYVSVPSGHVLSSKAIVVPAGCTALTVPVMLQSVAAPKKIAPASTVPSSIPSYYPEPHFVKIHPKPKIHPKLACLPSSSATTNTTSSTVTSFPQITTPLASTSPSSSSTVPKTRVNNLPTVSGKNIGGKKRTVDGKTLNVKSSPCSSEMYKDEMQALPQKQEYKLECNTTKDLQNSSLIKLSFNGDLNLLKDALRKTTVEIETLDSKSLTKTIGHPRRDSHDSSEGNMSDGSEDDYKPKCRKRRWHANEEQIIVLTRNKEKELVESIDKRWVPLEVVGDLAVRGRLLEDKFVNSGESDGRRIRRSDRISAKPRLDYADLERLPFEDLDEDSEESDCEVYTAHLSLHSQSTASPSPPQLSPILDQGHSQDVLMDTTPAKEAAAEAEDTNDSIHPVLEAQTSKAEDTDDSTHPVLEAQTSKAQDTDDSTHPVLEAQTSKAQDTDDSTHPVLEAQTSKAQDTDDSTHPMLEAQMSKAEDTDDSIHPVLEAQTSKAQDTDDSIHPVLEAQTSKDIGDIDSLSQANSCEECYYSSESESDMFDSCDKSLDDISKKKMMWKRHSEITLFLVKNADKFHSDDENGEHYCNICCRYKTNGIFHLSQHLKKHLVGVLRCSQCDFEACHEFNLVEHRKTRHAL